MPVVTEQAIVHRVLLYNPVRMVWTVASMHDNEKEAQFKALSWRLKSKRARVMSAPKPEPIRVKPAVNNSARTWREEQLEKQIQLADSKKYYKSPG